MTYYAEKGQITVENSNGISEKFQENTGLVYAESNIFEIFDFEFIAGDPSGAITNTGSAVISSSLAQKYFKLSPNEVNKAINKTFIIDNKTTFQISGIISDPPENTDLPFKIIANYRDQTTSNPYFNNGTDWHEGNSATNCYLLLSHNISASNFEKQLPAFYLKYFGEESTYEQKYIMQPLSELHSGMCGNYNRHVSKSKLNILSLIGLFLLIIASINFINLSAVQALKRFKEIGVKKILGVKRYQLFSQFLSETVFISLIASIAGLFIAQFLFVYLEEIIGYRLNLELLKNINTLSFLLPLALAVGLLSGLYPSFIMSGMKPSGTLKNTFSLKSSSGSLTSRRVLVIVQFTISLVLIIGTLVMQKQMNYFSNKDLGFNKDAILISTLPNANTNKLQLLKSNLLQYPDIEVVSYATRSPLAEWRVDNAINYPTLEKDMYSGNLKTADEDYLELFQLKLIAGENYSVIKDNGKAVVNRKLTELLGFKDPFEALGEKFKYGRGNMVFTISGVVEDFHAQSLHQNMDYVILSNLPWNIKEIAIKINPSTASLSGFTESIKKIQTEWQKTFPDAIFNYNFLDQKIETMYKEEQRTTSLIQLFALVAILIGCLGLFGLISYVTSQKIKEIGIRRVNGAKISEILTMLNKDFIKWVAIAFVISCPIAYYAMNKWLENFAYKTTLSWWIFALAGVLALGIALLTVSWQSWRAATRNPVEALRYE
jgi:ABC-type antimicrobial peptide transport system permease subunit